MGCYQIAYYNGDLKRPVIIDKYTRQVHPNSDELFYVFGTLNADQVMDAIYLSETEEFVSIFGQEASYREISNYYFKAKTGVSVVEAMKQKSDDLTNYVATLNGTDQQKYLIEELIKMNDSLIEESAIDSDNYIDNKGRIIPRVSNIIGGTFDKSQSGKYEINRQWGKQVDNIATSLILGKTPTWDTDLITDQAAKQFIDEFNTWLEEKRSKGYIILPQITVNKQDGSMAGTTDILAISPYNFIEIYDIKTSLDSTQDAKYDKDYTGNGYTRSKRDQHGLQLAAYTSMIEEVPKGMTITVTASILPFKLTKGSDNKITAIEKEKNVKFSNTINKYKAQVEAILQEVKDTLNKSTIDKPDAQKIEEIIRNIKRSLAKQISIWQNSIHRKGRPRERVPSQIQNVENLLELSDALNNTQTINAYLNYAYNFLKLNDKAKGSLTQDVKTLFDKKIKIIENSDNLSPKQKQELFIETISFMYEVKEALEQFEPFKEQLDYISSISNKNSPEHTKISEIQDELKRLESLYDNSIIPVMARWIHSQMPENRVSGYEGSVKMIERLKKDKLKAEQKLKELKDKGESTLKQNIFQRKINMLSQRIKEVQSTGAITIRQIENELKRVTEDSSPLDMLLTPVVWSADNITGTVANFFRNTILKVQEAAAIWSREYVDRMNNYVAALGLNRMGSNASLYEGLYEKTVDRHGKEIMSFVSRYNMKSFYEDKKRQSEDKIGDWINDNTSFIGEQNFLNLKSEIADVQNGVVKSKGAWIEFLRQNIYTEHEDVKQIFENSSLEVAIEQAEKMLLAGNYRFLQVNSELRVPINKYRNSEYDKLYDNNNRPIGEKGKMHEFLVKEYLAAQTHLPFYLRPGLRLPSIRKTDDEVRSEGVKEWAKEFTARVKGLTDVESDDELRYGSEAENFVPVYFVGQIEANEVSLDLVGNIMRFKLMAEKYGSKVDTLYAPVLATKNILNTRITEKKDGLGRNVINSTLGRVLGARNSEEYVEGQSNTAKWFQSWIDAQLFGRYKDRNEVSFMGGVIRADKVADQLSRLASVTQLALAPLSDLANSLNANVQIMIESAAGEFYNSKNYAWANGYYTRNMGGQVFDGFSDRGKPDNMLSQLNQLYDFMQGDFEDQFGRSVSGSVMGQLISTNTLMAGRMAGEHHAQTVNALMIMKGHIIKLSDTEQISIIDAYEKGKDGRVKIKDEVAKKYREYNGKELELVDSVVKGRIHGLNKQLNGVYNNMDWLSIQHNTLGRMVLMYRKFFPPGMKRRWKKLGYNPEMQYWSEGFYRTGFRVIASDFNNMVKWMMRKENTLSDLEKRNMRRFLTETSMILSLSIVIAMMTGSGDDDDDEINPVLMYEARRLKSELFAYANPWDMIKIMRSPFGQYTFIQRTGRFLGQLGDPTAEYEKDTGFWQQGDSKLWARFVALFGVTPSKYSAEEANKVLNLIQN